MKNNINEIKRLQQLANIKLNENFDPQAVFAAVKKTLKGDNVMSKIEKDGIYIRLAGSEQNGEVASKDWAKVFSFNV